jgi:hypothetical protein
MAVEGIDPRDPERVKAQFEKDASHLDGELRRECEAIILDIIAGVTAGLAREEARDARNKSGMTKFLDHFKKH